MVFTGTQRKENSSNSENKFRRYFLSALYTAFILLFLLISTAQSWLPAIGHWFFVSSKIGNAEAIVVMAGGGAERLCHGIELFKRGLAPELWYTGDKPLETRTDFMDVEMARYLAARRGVPGERIFFLASTSTFEDGKAVAALARKRQIKSVIMVTSWYHTRRAEKVLRHCLADPAVVVYVSSSTNLPFTPDNWWRDEDGQVALVDEAIKTALYWRRYGIAPW